MFMVQGGSIGIADRGSMTVQLGHHCLNRTQWEVMSHLI